MTKTKSMRVRLTDEEWQHAEAASISLLGHPNKSRLLRKLLRDYVGIGPDLVDKELKEFRAAVRQLTGISRNLNQITARINKNEKELSHLSENYLERIKAKVEDVNTQLKYYIAHTVTRFQAGVNNDE